MGIDAGLTAPGFAVVATTSVNPIGNVLLAECFIPEWKKEKDVVFKKTEQDTWRIGQIVRRIFDIVDEYTPNVIVAELPTGGAQSGGAIRGMAYSTAMTVTALEGITRYAERLHDIVYITPLDNKKGGTGLLKWNFPLDQGKWETFLAITKLWPNVKWPMKKRQPTEHDDAKCWAAADALSCIATYLRNAKVLPPLK